MSDENNLSNTIDHDDVYLTKYPYPTSNKEIYTVSLDIGWEGGPLAQGINPHQAVVNALDYVRGIAAALESAAKKLKTESKTDAIQNQ